MDKMKLYTLLVILIMLFMVTGCSSKENLIYSLEEITIGLVQMTTM